MMEICSKTVCTGCAMCANACTYGAIQMREDTVLGHLRPEIDADKCMNCGLCQRLCPCNHVPEQREPFLTYASWAKDENERKTSSSGGVVASLSRQFIEDGGYVVGTFLDERMAAKMKVTNDEETLNYFKGSKYVQAETGHVYLDCVKLLREGNRVLFSGTPCQCAAMKSIAGKYSEQLYLIELICHGVPSPRAWKMHYNSLKNDFANHIKTVKFRSQTFSICLTLEDETGRIIYQKNKYEDPYLIAFLNGELFAEGCFNCVYAQRKRVADLVVGDFWGLGEKITFPYSVRKVSVVGVMTEKGKHLLDSTKTLELVPRSYDEAVEGNPQLRAPFQKPNNYLQYKNLTTDEKIRRILYDEEKMILAERQYRMRKRKERFLYPIRCAKSALKVMFPQLRNRH